MDDTPDFSQEECFGHFPTNNPQRRMSEDVWREMVETRGFHRTVSKELSFSGIKLNHEFMKALAQTFDISI